MDEDDADSGTAWCDGAAIGSRATETEEGGGETSGAAGTDNGAETGGARGLAATGSGSEGGGCGACGLANCPVAVVWTGILGSDCVEVGGMEGTGAGIGGGLVAAAGTGGREVVIVTDTDMGAVVCAG